MIVELTNSLKGKPFERQSLFAWLNVIMIHTPHTQFQRVEMNDDNFGYLKAEIPLPTWAYVVILLGNLVAAAVTWIIFANVGNHNLNEVNKT